MSNFCYLDALELTFWRQLQGAQVKERALYKLIKASTWWMRSVLYSPKEPRTNLMKSDANSAASLNATSGVDLDIRVSGRICKETLAT